MTEEYEVLRRRLQDEYPLAMFNGASQLITTVRRMKSEQEAGLPVPMRTGAAISVESGKAANQMTESDWNQFYAELKVELARRYPQQYASLFD